MSALQRRRSTLLSVGMSFGIGMVVAAAWAAYTKQSLARTYGAGAAELRRELEARGSALRVEIEQLAADSAVAAVREEISSFGVTAGMLADLRSAIEAAEAVRLGARRAGETVQRYIERLRRG